MTQHFTSRTVSASCYCKKCEKFTQHRIDSNRKGPCLECIARLDAQHAQAQLQPKTDDDQQRFLFSAPGIGAA